MSTGAAIRVAIGIFNYAFLMLFPGTAVFGQSSESKNSAIIHEPGTAFKLTFAVESWIQETTQDRYSKHDFTVHYKPASLTWIIDAIPDNHLIGRFSSEINRLQQKVREVLDTESIPNGDNNARRIDYYRQMEETLESMHQIVRNVLRLHPDWFKLGNARFEGSSEIQWEERRPPTAGRPSSVVRVEAEPFSLSADRISLRFSSPGKGGIIIQTRLKALNAVTRRLRSLSAAGFDASEADRTLITRFQDLAFRFIKSLEDIYPPKYRSLLNGESGLYHLDFRSNIFEYMQVRWKGSWIKSFGEPTQSTIPIDKSRTLWGGIPVMDDAQPYYTLIGDDYLDPDFPKWQDGFRNILQTKVDGSGNTGVDRSAGGFGVVGSWPEAAAGKVTFISISNGFKKFYRDDWKWNHRYTFSWSLELLHGVAASEKKPPTIVVLVQSGDELKPAQALTYGAPHVIELQYESPPSENTIAVSIAVDDVEHQIPAARTAAGEGRMFRTESFVLLPDSEPAGSEETGSQ